MGSVALLALAFVMGGSPQDGRVETEWGWYRVEAESGENPDAEIAIVLSEEEAAPEGQAAVEVQATGEDSCPGAEGCPAPAPAPGPSIDEEIARFSVIDCEAVRGRYLQRILELYGVNAFSLQQDELAAWTRRRPTGSTVTAFGTGSNTALGDPALAPLYGEPPVPPGALSFDLSLQVLAKQLLQCDQPPPAPAASPGQGAPTVK